ncbi:MAG: shikimate dehydrogenase [Proteobacteria bacterium]|nr:shikimate dehydrogenase [Pseudomonadota bacterium]
MSLSGSAVVPSPTGSTRLYAVLGHPVDQVMAPSLMNPLFAARQIDAVMVPIEVEPARLGSVIQGLKAIGNFDGLLVTVPHKFAVCGYADRLGETATIAGSANALRREADGSWSADNFDGAGFVAGLRKAGHTLEGAAACLVGAGGAGVSIAAALMLAGVGRLLINDVACDRLDRLVSRLATRWPGKVSAAPQAATPGLDFIINATPLGLRPHDPLPFEIANLSEGTIVADIIMKPAETRLLEEAQRRGLPTHPGIHMLTEQIELYRSFFRLQ